MKGTGRYCPIEDGFNLDEELHNQVTKSDKWILNIKECCENSEQSNKILKAIAINILNEMD